MEDHNSPEAVTKRATQEDPIVMYLVIRESLNMSSGKIGAQCGHAAQMILMNFYSSERNEPDRFTPLRPEEVERALSHMKKNNLFRSWLNSSFRKVTLRADEKEWIKLKAEVSEEDRIVVVDSGLTEIPAGSETVIAVWPMHKSQRPKILQKLQALK